MNTKNNLLEALKAYFQWRLDPIPEEARLQELRAIAREINSLTNEAAELVINKMEVIRYGSE